MTMYQGGKKKLCKDIHNVIVEFERERYSTKLPYLEPFLGMGSVMSEFGKDKDDRKLIGSDLNEDVILMWQGLQKGWTPPLNVDYEYYCELKRQTTPSPERGFVGCACSFSGHFFDCYKGKYIKHKNHAEIGWTSVQKVLPYMMNVKIDNARSYDSYEPSNMLIYCDPPYRGNTIKTKFFQKFNHDKFWNKMREWSNSNLVFISESSAPDDFVPIWSKDYIVARIKKGSAINKKYTECLFVHNSYLEKCSL